MNIYNEQKNKTLLPEIKAVLNKIRSLREYDTQKLVQEKADLLNDYLTKAKLSSCVIAVSGGIDSALVLALTVYAQKQANSPIKNIVPVLLPIFDENATTGQQLATSRAIELCGKFDLVPKIIDLTDIHQLLAGKMANVLGVRGDQWAKGQLVAYIRTPAIYYATSLLANQKTPGLVVGTTNKDEGAYLGYFGKASDGMVDLQLISDLHKSDVYRLAKYLGVTQDVLQATPTGDMYDGRVDEEVFGAPYDFVELFLNAKEKVWVGNVEIDLGQAVKEEVEGLSIKARQQFDELSLRLENLHRYNGHKYLGKSPAVHLDVLEYDFAGRWDTYVWKNVA